MNFDPFLRYKEYLANPQDFIRVADLVADAVALRCIKTAPNMDALKKAFAAPAATAKRLGDDWLLGKLVEAKDARKLQLEAK